MKNLNKFKKYFDIRELVDEQTYNRFRDDCWQFIDEKLIDSLLVIRDGLCKPMTINNWLWGGKFKQRGLRHNLNAIVQNKENIYLSAHMLGKGVDFDVKDMIAEDVRSWIIENGNKFEHKIRLEHKKDGKPISWVHLDVLDNPENPLIYLFNV
jgi:hypothetical protein